MTKKSAAGQDGGFFPHGFPASSHRVLCVSRKHGCKIVAAVGNTATHHNCHGGHQPVRGQLCRHRTPPPTRWGWKVKVKAGQAALLLELDFSLRKGNLSQFHGADREESDARCLSEWKMHLVTGERAAELIFFETAPQENRNGGGFDSIARGHQLAQSNCLFSKHGVKLGVKVNRKRQASSFIYPYFYIISCSCFVFTWITTF